MVAPILPSRSIASPSLPRLQPRHDCRPRAAPDRPTGPRAGVLAPILAALAVPLLPLVAWGQAAQDDQICRRVSASTAEQEERIAACSRVIASNQYPGARGSWAYNNRGLAYAMLGDAKAAYADYRKAHELKPTWELARDQFLRFSFIHSELNQPPPPVPPKP